MRKYRVIYTKDGDTVAENHANIDSLTKAMSFWFFIGYDTNGPEENIGSEWRLVDRKRIIKSARSQARGCRHLAATLDKMAEQLEEADEN